MIETETQRELDRVREHLEALIAANDARYVALDVAHQEALRVAFSANDRRLENMNAFREALSDQQRGLITRAENDAQHNTLIEKNESLRAELQNRLDSEVKPLAVKLEAIGKPNWPLMASLVSVCFVMLTGMWTLIGLKTDTILAPVALVVEQTRVSLGVVTEKVNGLETMASNSTQADASSKTDRSQLNDRLRLVETAVQGNAAEHREQFSVMQARLVEVETQFCGGDVIRSLMHASDMRLFSMLWAATFPGQHYPTDNAFYPAVGRCGTIPIK